MRSMTALFGEGGAFAKYLRPGPKGEYSQIASIPQWGWTDQATAPHLTILFNNMVEAQQPQGAATGTALSSGSFATTPQTMLGNANKESILPGMNTPNYYEPTTAPIELGSPAPEMSSEQAQNLASTYKGGTTGMHGEKLPPGATAFDRYGMPYYGPLQRPEWAANNPIMTPAYDMAVELLNWGKRAWGWITTKPTEQPKSIEAILEPLGNIQIAGKDVGLIEGSKQTTGAALAVVGGLFNKNAEQKLGELMGTPGGQNIGLALQTSQEAIDSFNNLPDGWSYISRAVSAAISTIFKPFQLAASGLERVIGTTQEMLKGASFSQAYETSRILYTSWYDEAIKEEYINRLEQGANPVLLAKELENPIVEAAGQTVLDPLWVVGWVGKTKWMDSLRLGRLREFSTVAWAEKMKGADFANDLRRTMAEAGEVAGLVEDAKFSANIAAKTELAVRQEKIAVSLAEKVAELRKVIPGELSKMMAPKGAFQQFLANTPGGKVNLMQEIVHTISNSIAQDIMPLLKASDKRPAIGRAMQIYLDLAKMALMPEKLADGAPNPEFIAVIQRLSELPGVSSYISKGGMKLGSFLGGMLYKVDDAGQLVLDTTKLRVLRGIVEEANKLENQDKFYTIITTKLEGYMRQQFPDLLGRVKIQEDMKVLAAAKKAIPQWMTHYIGDEIPEWMATLAKSDGFLQQKLYRPLNNIFNFLYMGINYPWAFRNRASNNIHILLDWGLGALRANPEKAEKWLSDVGMMPIEGMKGFSGTTTKWGDIPDWKIPGISKFLNKHMPAGLSNKYEKNSAIRVTYAVVKSELGKVLREGRAIPTVETLRAVGYTEAETKTLIGLVKKYAGNTTMALKEFKSGKAVGWQARVSEDMMKWLNDHDLTFAMDEAVQYAGKDKVKLHDAVEALKAGVRAEGYRALANEAPIGDWPEELRAIAEVGNDLIGAGDEATDFKFIDDLLHQKVNQMRAASDMYGEAVDSVYYSANRIVKGLGETPEAKTLGEKLDAARRKMTDVVTTIMEDARRKLDGEYKALYDAKVAERPMTGLQWRAHRNQVYIAAREEKFKAFERFLQYVDKEFGPEVGKVASRTDMPAAIKAQFGDIADGQLTVSAMTYMARENAAEARAWDMADEAVFMVSRKVKLTGHPVINAFNAHGIAVANESGAPYSWQSLTTRLNESLPSGANPFTVEELSGARAVGNNVGGILPISEDRMVDLNRALENMAHGRKTVAGPLSTAAVTMDEAVDAAKVAKAAPEAPKRPWWKPFAKKEAVPAGYRPYIEGENPNILTDPSRQWQNGLRPTYAPAEKVLAKPLIKTKAVAVAPEVQTIRTAVLDGDFAKLPPDLQKEVADIAENIVAEAKAAPKGQRVFVDGKFVSSVGTESPAWYSEFFNSLPSNMKKGISQTLVPVVAQLRKGKTPMSAFYKKLWPYLLNAMTGELAGSTSFGQGGYNKVFARIMGIDIPEFKPMPIMPFADDAMRQGALGRVLFNAPDAAAATAAIAKKGFKSLENVAEEITDVAQTRIIDTELANLKKMNKAELALWMDAHGMKTKGTKAELLEGARQALIKETHAGQPITEHFARAEELGIDVTDLRAAMPSADELSADNLRQATEYGVWREQHPQQAPTLEDLRAQWEAEARAVEGAPEVPIPPGEAGAVVETVKPTAYMVQMTPAESRAEKMLVNVVNSTWAKKLKAKFEIVSSTEWAKSNPGDGRIAAVIFDEGGGARIVATEAALTNPKQAKIDMLRSIGTHIYGRAERGDDFASTEFKALLKAFGVEEPAVDTLDAHAAVLAALDKAVGEQFALHLTEADPRVIIKTGDAIGDKLDRLHAQQAFFSATTPAAMNVHGETAKQVVSMAYDIVSSTHSEQPGLVDLRKVFEGLPEAELGIVVNETHLLINNLTKEGMLNRVIELVASGRSDDEIVQFLRATRPDLALNKYQVERVRIAYGIPKANIDDLQALRTWRAHYEAGDLFTVRKVAEEASRKLAQEMGQEGDGIQKIVGDAVVARAVAAGEKAPELDRMHPLESQLARDRWVYEHATDTEKSWLDAAKTIPQDGMGNPRVLPDDGSVPTLPVLMGKNYGTFSKKFSEIEKVLGDNLDAIWEPMGDMTPQKLAALNSWGRDLDRKMAEVRPGILATANAARKFTLLDYADRHIYDSIGAYIYPYGYWYRGTYTNWAVRMARSPQIAAAYGRYRDMLNKIHAGMPDWWKQQINTNELFGLDSTNPLWFNLEATLNPLNGILGVDFDDPDRRTTWVGGLFDTMGKFGPNIWTPFSLGLAATYMLTGKQDAAESWVGRLIPATAFVKAATSSWMPKLPTALGGTGGLELDPLMWTQGGMTKYDRNRVGTMLTKMSTEGVMVAGELVKITPAQAIDAGRLHSGPIWDMAQRAAAMERQWSGMAGAALGVGFKGRSQQDFVIDQFWTQMRTLMGMKDAMSTDEYQQAWTQLEEQYPFMDTLLLSRKASPQRDEAFAWSVLGRIPPGRTGDYAKMVGLDSRLMDKFYKDKGNFYGDSIKGTIAWPEADRDRLMAAMIDLGVILEVPPSTLKHEWKEAHLHYSEMMKNVPQRIQDLTDIYFSYGDDPEKARAFIAQYPEVNQYLDQRSQQILSDPILNKYYGGISFLESAWRRQMYTAADELFGKDIQDLNWAFWQISDKNGNTDVFLTDHPQLKMYWKYLSDQKGYMAQHLADLADSFPETPNGIIREDYRADTIGTQDVMQGLLDEQMKTAADTALVEAYTTGGRADVPTNISDFVNIEGEKTWPGVVAKNEQFEQMAVTNPGGAAAYIKANPDLQLFRQWEKEVRKNYNNVLGGKGSKDTSVEPAIPWAQYQEVMYQASPPLPGLVIDYFTGQALPETARKRLREIWVAAGQPYNDFDVWLGIVKTSWLTQATP